MVNQVLIISAFVIGMIFCGLNLIFLIYANRKVRINGLNIGLAYLLGTGMTSIFIFLFEFVGIKYSYPTIWMAITLPSLVLFIKNKNNFFESFQKIKFKLSGWDIIPMILIFGLGTVSIWRTFYYPPYSYDSTIGIDLIAKFAVRDGSIAQSQLFAELLPFYNGYTNQLFYAPYTMLMQILTRGIGIDFGQVWLGFNSLFFGLFFYGSIKKVSHPIIAIIALMLVLFAPEFYAYSFILQTDYANAIFFFIGVYYFGKYNDSKIKSDLVLSIIGMFFACWTRSETIFFMPFGSLWLLIKNLDFNFQERGLSYYLHQVKHPFLFSFIPALAVIIWSFIFVEFFLPKEINLTGQIDPDTSRGLFSLIKENYINMNEIVILNSLYWNYAVTLFLIVFFISISFYLLNKKSRKILGINTFFWILVLYGTYHMLIIIFPNVVIPLTFRRGFFKFIPLFGFFFAVNNFSDFIKHSLNLKKRTSH